MAETKKPVSYYCILNLNWHFQIIQISREALLNSFIQIDEIPEKMTNEMQVVQPLTHLLSTYVIRPIAFDNNPFVLPKSA